MMERIKKILNLFKLSARDAELEFLPAVLEVTETPPAPLGRITLWVIVLFFLIAVIWASVGRVDIVAIAQGKIVPSDRVKIIQPLESGVVKNIYVKEGETVEAGQILIELDSTVSSADKETQNNDLIILKLDRMRIQGLIEKIKTENKHKKIEFKVQDAIGLPKQIALQEIRFKTQHNEYKARLDSVQEQLKQSKAERNATDNRIQQLQATIPLITERADSMKKVVDTGVVSRAQWLEIEEQRITQVKQLDIEKDKRIQINAAIANVMAQQQALQAQFEAQWLQELSDTENKIITLEQELKKTTQRVSLQRLVSPVKGAVQQLSVHTIGGVVTPAQELMLIVPGEGALQIEVWIENKDIGFVNAGQTVEIKVETFPFTKYGTIKGKILTISNDAIAHEQLDLVYAAQVFMEKTTMHVNGKVVNLTPGMAVTVEVNLGKRRLIEYLISPLLRFKDESIKER